MLDTQYCSLDTLDFYAQDCFKKVEAFNCKCSSQIVGCFHFNSLFSSSRMSLVSWGYPSSCPGSRLSPSPWHGLRSCTAPWHQRTLNMTSSVPCAKQGLLYRDLGELPTTGLNRILLTSIPLYFQVSLPAVSQL